MSIPRNLGNFADNVNTNGKVEVTGINATGTPTASTALLGNGTWGTVTTAPAGSTGQVQYNNAGAFGALSSGTSGQLLTSAGAGSAPTWATPAAGGGTVTMTSSGAITAGLGVIVNSDGTASVPVVTRTITSLGPERSVTTDQEPNQVCSMIYCESFGVYLMFYTRVTDNYLMVAAGNMTATGRMEWYTFTVIRSTVCTKVQAIWVESLKRWYVTYQNGTTAFISTGIVSTSLGVGAVWQSATSMWNNAGTAPTIAFDETSNMLICGCGTDGSGLFNYAIVVMQGANLSLRYQKAASFVAGTYFLKYWPLAGKVVLFTTVSNQLKAYLISITGTSDPEPLIGSQQSLSSLSYAPKNAAYASNNGNLILVNADFNSSGMNTTMVSISGSTITCGSFYNISGSSNTAQTVGINYVQGVNAYVISYGTTSPYKLNSLIATVSGSVISYGTPTTLISGTGNALTYSNVYDSRLKLIVSYTQINYDNLYTIAQTNGSGTLTSSNFVGIANTSVSTGNSFTVAVSGSTNTAVSGLTAGNKYYLAGDGTLILSPDVPAGNLNTLPVPVGVALSSTSIVRS